jgi:hypothetical protein
VEGRHSEALTGSYHRPRWGTVNEFLVVYLDSIDERLLEYVDDEELRIDAVRRLR